MTARRQARITKSVVDNLAVGQECRDTELKGFVVRNQGGRVSYAVHKRVKGGPLALITIGPHGEPWTPATARTKALEIISLMAQGIHPNVQRKQEQAKAVTLRDAVARFKEEWGPKLKPRTREEYERLLDKSIVPELGGIRLQELTRADISRFHARRSDRPHHANFALAVLSKLMSWAEQDGLRPEGANPCRGIKKYPARKKERFLTLAEFERLGHVLAEAEAAERESLFAIAAIRLLMLTGARRNEILELRWSYVDLERGLLNLPDSKTGQKVLRLSPPALAVLQALPRIEGNPYVICGQTEGEHLVNLQKPWNRLRKAAGLSDVRIHDLRHSFASVAAASGASLPMIGKLLGHSNPQTTARYAHLADDPVQQLNSTVADAIAEAMQLPQRRPLAG